MLKLGKNIKLTALHDMNKKLETPKEMPKIKKGKGKK
jgi:hypothetical protein